MGNRKGGVGKTTSVINLVTYLAIVVQKILTVDTDPQVNCSSILLKKMGIQFAQRATTCSMWLWKNENIPFVASTIREPFKNLVNGLVLKNPALPIFRSLDGHNVLFVHLAEL